MLLYLAGSMLSNKSFDPKISIAVLAARLNLLTCWTVNLCLILKS